jgi:hypothetical protein
VWFIGLAREAAMHVRSAPQIMGWPWADMLPVLLVISGGFILKTIDIPLPWKTVLNLPYHQVGKVHSLQQ